MRFHGEGLSIPMTGNGVYTINATSNNNSLTGIDFSNIEKVNTGMYLADSYVRAVGAINGDLQLNLKGVNGDVEGVLIGGGDKYTAGSTNSVEVASDITLNGKLNINIEGAGITAISLQSKGQGKFNDNVSINGVSNGNNSMYGVNVTGASTAIFEKDLNINLQNNSAQVGSNLGYAIRAFGNNSSVTTKGATTIVVNSATQTNTGLEINGNGAKGSFADMDITLTGNASQRAVYVTTGQADFSGNTKITLSKYSNTTGSAAATALHALSSAIINVNQNKDKTVQIQGHIVSTTNGVINMSLTNKDSWWEGDAQLNASGKAINVELANGAVWNPSCNSTAYKGATLNLHDQGIVDMSKTSSKYSSLSIGALNGNGGIFNLETDIVNNSSDKFTVDTTTSAGIHSIDIIDANEATMDQIAQGTGNGLLLATAPTDIKFTANDREQSLFNIRYSLKEELLAGNMSEWKLDSFEILKDVPTSSVDTVLSTNALNYHTWRTENDQLMQRMGELRHNGEDSKGVWVRMNGSKIGRDGKFGFKNQYTSYELGYDALTKQTADMTRYTGVALSYADGKGNYSRGTGDNSNFAVHVYNTEIGKKGHYLDMGIKLSNLKNDFDISDTNGKKITGDFKNTGIAFNIEYGRKNDLKRGWYIEPQAQFTVGYLGGDTYTTSNGIKVEQSGIKTAVMRLGFNIGKEFGQSIVYAKANLLHEFGGGYAVTMSDATGRIHETDSFSDTWLEYGIGAAIKAGKNSRIYLDAARSSGSKFRKDWKWNIGARWTF